MFYINNNSLFKSREYWKDYGENKLNLYYLTNFIKTSAYFIAI